METFSLAVLLRSSSKPSSRNNDDVFERDEAEDGDGCSLVEVLLVAQTRFAEADEALDEAHEAAEDVELILSGRPLLDIAGTPDLFMVPAPVESGACGVLLTMKFGGCG